jgi:glycosyltransferase involved in cell wall biosynthesis
MNGSLHSLSKNELLLSFYELDSPTETEINLLKNVRTAFSSRYTVDLFKSKGVECHHVPLGFDSFNFYKKDKAYHVDERIVFNVVGKLEKRKHHAKIIKAWVKKYGNNKKYSLQCAIYNPFFSPQDNNAAVGQILENQKYFNVQFFPVMDRNSQYNDYLNSAHIVLGCSGGEGWGLPEFQSVCLGKHAVILDARGYKDWANEDVAVMLPKKGKIDAYDGMFFKEGEDFNQGFVADWDEDDFISACEEAIRRVENNVNNDEGEKLKDVFTYEQTLNAIENILSE